MWAKTNSTNGWKHIQSIIVVTRTNSMTSSTYKSSTMYRISLCSFMTWGSSRYYTADCSVSAGLHFKNISSEAEVSGCIWVFSLLQIVFSSFNICSWHRAQVNTTNCKSQSRLQFLYCGKKTWDDLCSLHLEGSAWICLQWLLALIPKMFSLLFYRLSISMFVKISPSL